MADVLTSIRALAPNASAVSTVAAAGGDISGMVTEAQVKAGELYLALNNIIAALPPGDVNIAALEAMSSTVFTFEFWVGQLFFSVPAQSGHIASAALNWG